MTRPNVLCFVLDQLRYDHLGCTGNGEIRTPNIDALADEGVLFERSYVNNPLCMPSRATLFTGLMPREHGVRTNGIPLDPSLPTLPGALREAGYHTRAIGKLHLHLYGTPNGADPADLEPDEYPELRELWTDDRLESLPEPYYGLEETDFTGGHVSWIFGEYVDWLERRDPAAAERLSENHPDNESRRAPEAFDWSLPEELHYNRWIADRTRACLRERAGDGTGSGGDDGRPFFLWCSFPDPHHPFAAPEPWGSMYDPDEMPLPTRREGELEDLPPHYRDAFEDEETQLSGLHGSTDIGDEALREQLALTYGMVSFVDREIGRVMATLEEEDLREETVVVFLSDHGDAMGDHRMLRKGPFHFEGLLRVPEIWSWPGEFSEGVRSEGLTSAIDFAPTVLDCCDVPVPEGRAPEHRETEREPPAWPGRSLRPQLELEGETDDVTERVVIENDEDYLGLRPRTLVTDRYKLTVYPGETYGELFDLETDPDELHNRWDDPDYEAVKADLIREFFDAYVLAESGLPRRLCHA